MHTLESLCAVGTRQGTGGTGSRAAPGGAHPDPKSPRSEPGSQTQIPGAAAQAEAAFLARGVTAGGVAVGARWPGSCFLAPNEGSHGTTGWAEAE